MTEHSEKLGRIAFLVIARDEALVIGKTVENIRCAMRNSDSLFVVSDHSCDLTAHIAESTGAEVFVRNSGINNKGAAITWFVQENQSRLLGFDVVVVLDADSSVKNDFIKQLTYVWTDKTLAAQCFLQPVEYGDNPIGNVIALSEIIEQDVFDSIRSALGFSVRLRGTGMVFTPAFLISLCPFIGTEVEDIVLSLLVSVEAVKVSRLSSVIVYDPKPLDRNAASRQRGRWYRGQWDALWKYRRTVIKLMFQGLKGWAVLGSVFLKPRWLKIFILCVFGAAFIWLPVISILCFCLALIDILLILIGAAKLKDKALFRQSLIHTLGFIWMWIKAIGLSFKNQPWARARQVDYYPETPGEARSIISSGEVRIN